MPSHSEAPAPETVRRTGAIIITVIAALIIAGVLWNSAAIGDLQHKRNAAQAAKTSAQGSASAQASIANEGRAIAGAVEAECKTDKSFRADHPQLCPRASQLATATPALIHGPPGVQGPQGLPGFPGPRGSRGPTGKTGPMGEPGAAGAQGPMGEVGPVGETGPSGAEGSSGPQGEPGPSGPSGPIGPTGPAGPACPDGYTLATVTPHPADSPGDTWVVCAST